MQRPPRHDSCLPQLPRGAQCPRVRLFADMSEFCVSLQCSHLVEVGFASDVLARMNVERSQASRSYELNGVPTKLSPLPSDPTLSAQAQAFAEYLANTGELENYTGLDPSGEITTGATVGGPAYDSAGVDDQSWVRIATHWATCRRCRLHRSWCCIRQPGSFMGC